MIDDDVGATVHVLQEDTRPVPGAADVVEQVVLDQDALRLLARMDVVGAHHVQGGPAVAHDVVRERHVAYGHPRRGAVLVARGEEDAVSILRIGPVVLEQVAVDQDALGVLQLEDVLDRPVDPGVARAVRPPRERLDEVVLAEFDIRRHEVRDARIRAAEQDVLAGALQIVVHDLERSGTVPAGDRLAVGADLVVIGQIRIHDRRAGAVHQDPPADVTGGRAVDVAAVEDDVGRNLRERGVAARCLQRHQPVVGGARRRPRRRDLDADEPEVVGAGRRADRGCGVGADDLRHEARLTRAHPRARSRQARERRALDIDPAAAARHR